LTSGCDKQQRLILFTEKMTQKTEMAQPSANRLVLAAIVAIFVYGTVASLLGTLLPALSARFHLTVDQNGKIAAAQALGLMLSSAAAGPLADNISKKIGFVLGMALMALSVIALPHAGGFAMVSILIFFLGLGSGTIVTVSNSLVSDVSARNRASLLSLANVFFGLGGLFTPFVTANLLGGNITRLSYLVAALSVAGLLFECSTRMPPPVPERRFSPAAALRLPGKPLLFLLCVFVLLYVSCEVAFWNFLPKYLITQGIRPSRALNILALGFASGMLFGRIAGTRILARYSAYAVTVSGSLLVVAASLCVLNAGHFVAAWASVFCTGFVMGPIYPGAMAMIGDAFPRMTSTCMGLAVTAGWAGVALSSWLIGAIAGADNARLRLALFTVPVAAVLMIVVDLTLRPMLPRREDEPALGM
jgi:fucose permease